MITWAWDSESYYANGFNLESLGSWQYIFHPDADHYLVSVAASDGTKFVGKPEDAPWDRMAGGIWVCHNTSHDGLVFQRLVRDSRIPNVQPSEWVDTADLAAFCGYPRSLKLAVQTMLGVAISKGTRDSMKGKRWHEMTPEFKAEVEQYALGDSEWCLKLWQEYGDQFPQSERRLSQLTREMGWRGVRIDVERVERHIQQLKLLCWGAESKIPWADSAPALSYPRLVAECLKAGISAPASLAKDSEECDAWEERYASKYPWVGAMRIKRRTNAILKKLETIRSRIREDGTVPTELKFFGGGLAGRWSGSGGLNWQNLPRDEFFGLEWWRTEGQGVIGDIVPAPTEGVNLRNCLIPREGRRFLDPDLSQIEPRISAVICHDTQFVQMLVAGHSPYDAHAISTGMCEPGEPLKKRNPQLYALAKARELALGYQAGHHKFILMAPQYVSQEECERIFSAPVTEAQTTAYEEYLRKCRIPEWLAKWKSADDKGRTALVNSWLIVTDFRQKKPKTVNMWYRLGDALRASVGENLEVMLPSGRPLRFNKVAMVDDEITAITPQFGKLTRQKWYGGAVYNQVIQGTARDCFAECWLRLDDAGLGDYVVLTIHDEVLLDAPLSVQPETVLGIMSQSPSWMPSLPVASECPVMMCYTK